MPEAIWPKPHLPLAKLRPFSCQHLQPGRKPGERFRCALGVGKAVGWDCSTCRWWQPVPSVASDASADMPEFAPRAAQISQEIPFREHEATEDTSAEKRTFTGVLAGDTGKPPKLLSFYLPVVPTAQARPRHGMIQSGGRVRHMTFKSAKQKADERTLEACLLPHRPSTPMTGPLRLSFVAALPVPKSVSKKRLQAMLACAELPQKKPDLDNLAKQLKDAMTRLQYWQDDSQVVELRCQKIWGTTGYWRVTLEAVGGAR